MTGFERLDLVAGQRLEARDALDFLAEKFHAQAVLASGGADFHRVAAHAEIGRARTRCRCASYCKSTRRVQELFARQSACPTRIGMHHRLVILLAADAVNARDAGHHHHVAPREQRTHGGEPQPLDLLVHARILLDERVGARDVGLRLVIIEVADEIFDGVVREKALELGVKLRGERLVVRNDQRGLVHVLDDVGHGEGLARAGHAEQRLVLRAGQNALGQLRNRLRLVAGGLVDETSSNINPNLRAEAAVSTKRPESLEVTPCRSGT